MIARRPEATKILKHNNKTKPKEKPKTIINKSVATGTPAFNRDPFDLGGGGEWSRCPSCGWETASSWGWLHEKGAGIGTVRRALAIRCGAHMPVPAEGCVGALAPIKSSTHLHRGVVGVGAV